MRNYPATIQQQHEQNIVERVEHRLLEHTRHVDDLITKLARGIPVYVDERLYLPTATTLTLLPQSQNLELISFILVVITAAGGGTLTLGNRTIPLPQGNTWLPLGGGKLAGMLLNNGDIRQLTQTVSGALGLELIGIELPDKGVF